MVFLPNLGVYRRNRLCGIPEYASAQSLDCLDLGQKSAFLNWKRRQMPIFKQPINGWAVVKSISSPDESGLDIQITSIPSRSQKLKWRPPGDEQLI
jgi:hypothetical protein